MPDLLLELIALFVYGPALVVLHELGHALFARPGGYRLTSFGVGLGRPIWRIVLSGPVVVHLDRWFFAGGAATAIPDGPPTTKRIWFHGGGLILQGVLAAVLLVLPDHWLVERVARFNLLVALTNAIPWRLAGHASDGWYILDALSGGRRTGSVLSQRSVLEQLARREASIGSPLGTAYADLCVAWADVLSGRNEEAAEFFADEPPETAVHPWTDALFHYVKAEWHREEGRPLAALPTARAGRASLGDDLGTDAVALLALAEARALVALDEPAAARRALHRVVGSPLAIQALPIVLWASLDANTEELEVATWKVARHEHEAWLDPGDPVLALCEAADELSHRGRVNAARAARETATRLARQTLRSADMQDRRTLSWRLRAAIHSPVEEVAAERR
ncbi:MAG: site-2 protease family protein [Myxococcales bacterium]|nr:site-2 protease family protein [Myxococcales bacterium]MCB9668865.1 site-2 protease family protein [Alphaproteobacteria bacterium]MCB9691191.1 site-2 protease family protein [Alphaproteobacteria bacterium]